MLGGYAIVEPPIEVTVPILPPNTVYVIIGGRAYYRYQSAYYLPLGNHRYQLVQEPNGEEGAQTQKPVNCNVATEGYEKFVLEGKTYYRKGSKYYKARVNDDGEILYEEVGEVSK